MTKWEYIQSYKGRNKEGGRERGRLEAKKAQEKSCVKQYIKIDGKVGWKRSHGLSGNERQTHGKKFWVTGDLHWVQNRENICLQQKNTFDSFGLPKKGQGTV